MGLRHLTCLFILGFVVALSGCSGSDSDREASKETPQESKPMVCVVNYPLAYFAKRIGNGLLDVEFSAPADIDPAYWKPDADVVAGFQKADLILLNGAGYEAWIGTVSLPQSKLIDTSNAFANRLIPIEGAVTHSHGPGGEHAHAGTAFTTWIDFAQAAWQARAVMEAFASSWPDERTTFEGNHATLEKELFSLDEEVKTIVAGGADVPLLVSHPVYQYFARRYELNIQSVHWEPDAMPSEREWMRLQEILNDHPAEWMIWEGEPLDDTVKRLRAMGIRILVFDPCGNTPESGDFMTAMKGNVRNLEMAFRK